MKEKTNNDIPTPAVEEELDRYEYGYYGNMIWTPIGDWVEYKDYARLKAEVERLREAIAEADDKLKLLAEWAVVCEVDSAQVNQVRDILREANAAKEGKPSK